jgi:hypothetical protein
MAPVLEVSVIWPSKHIFRDNAGGHLCKTIHSMLHRHTQSWTRVLCDPLVEHKICHIFEELKCTPWKERLTTLAISQWLLMHFSDVGKNVLKEFDEWPAVLGRESCPFAFDRGQIH